MDKPRTTPVAHADALADVLAGFVRWLDDFGEYSRDHQSFFAGPMGRRAKALYYRYRGLGTVAVTPMVFCEAFVPSARRFFHQPLRFPIADAHYAMGFAFLHEATGDTAYLERAKHFLNVLKTTRCRQFEEYCWGYPFDWVTRNGTIRRHTPLITSTPYVYDAFLHVFRLDGGAEWLNILSSIVRHACRDIKDFRTSDKGSTCSYTPFDSGGVINAAAYRAAMLASASRLFDEPQYWRIAESNLIFVLENQRSDGSWPYAVDGVRDFVDHFHTCFVLKAIAKIHAATGQPGCLAALARGLNYYLENLFDSDGLPRPFARAPRMTLYRRELYDCAECINLCLLLRDRFPECDAKLKSVVAAVLRDWVKPDGSFRSRKLLLGWDNVPMHRWAQAQMFRSLAFHSCDRTRSGNPSPAPREYSTSRSSEATRVVH